MSFVHKDVGVADHFVSFPAEAKLVMLIYCLKVSRPQCVHGKIGKSICSKAQSAPGGSCLRLGPYSCWRNDRPSPDELVINVSTAVKGYYRVFQTAALSNRSPVPCISWDAVHTRSE